MSTTSRPSSAWDQVKSCLAKTCCSRARAWRSWTQPLSDLMTSWSWSVSACWRGSTRAAPWRARWGRAERGGTRSWARERSDEMLLRVVGLSASLMVAVSGCGSRKRGGSEKDRRADVGETRRCKLRSAPGPAQDDTRLFRCGCSRGAGGGKATATSASLRTLDCASNKSFVQQTRESTKSKPPRGPCTRARRSPSPLKRALPPAQLSTAPQRAAHRAPCALQPLRPSRRRGGRRRDPSAPPPPCPRSA